MPSDLILVEPRDGVTVLRFNRPPAHAFCLELGRELHATLDRPEVTGAGALVLTGSGRFFSGGLDLKLVPGYSRPQQREFLVGLNQVIGRLYATPVPVVAAVNGHAVAGALVVALTTDYRVGPTGDSRFGLTEAQVGIPFPAAAMIVLLAECAPQDVRYTALWARTFGAEEALRRGLFDELQPPEAVLERAVAVAGEMARMPTDGYRRIKRQVRAAALAKLQEVVAAESDPMLEGWVSPDSQAASAAVLEASKRG